MLTPFCIPLSFAQWYQHFQTKMIKKVNAMKQSSISISFTILLLTLISCQPKPTQKVPTADELALKTLNQSYLQEWRSGNETGVLALFEEDARISPSSLCPIDSLDNMRQFWFPNDSSITTIHRFEASELSLEVLDTLGYSTQKTKLEWSYRKDDFRMGRYQEGIETTIFRKQKDGSWKIWRKMWQDVFVDDC